MTVTVLYPEDRQIPDLALEQEIFGPGARLIRAAKPSFAELDPADCAAAEADDHALGGDGGRPRPLSTVALRRAHGGRL